jgi:hypothetical protein
MAGLNLAKPRLATGLRYRPDHSAVRRDQMSENSFSVSASTRLA